MSEAGGSDPEHSPGPLAAGLHGQEARRSDTSGAAAVIPIHAPKHLRPAAPGPADPSAHAFRTAPQDHAQQGPVTFSQGELRLIFGLYGRKVAAGEWRDYAMDFLRDQAVFSIYRRSSEVPLYRIEKTPRLARKQGEYAAVAASGLILKRGGDLARVLAVLDKPLKIVR